VLLPHPARALAAATLLCAVTTGARIAGAQTTADTTAAPTARPAPRPDSARAQRLQGVTVSAVRQRGYAARTTTTATRTSTRLRDVPQTVGVVTRALIADQAMQNMTDVARYVPGVTMGQGEGHRDAPTIRGNSSTADFFVDGVRDDAQYYRDLYDAERVEAIKGANATTFGRGGGGGVINRVLKAADWAPTRALTLQGGSFAQRRGALDVGRGAGPVAGRLNAVWEHSAGFRDASDLRRFGVNPTAALALGTRTMVRAGYERFEDRRTVDRGLPSYQGRPSGAAITAFFGDPAASPATLRLDAADVTVEHLGRGGLAVRNRSRVAAYDKFYQNVFPGGAVKDTLGAQYVNLSGYNSTADRHNLFNQTDLTGTVATGSVRHTLLAGAEFGRQSTSNLRETGYFGAAGSTRQTALVPVADPQAAVPVDVPPERHGREQLRGRARGAGYVQDQVPLSPRLQALAGVRVERFAVRLDNRRNGQTLRRDDRLVSPRLGLVYKPAEAASVYATRTASFLPASGDQFSSLSATTQALRPERFVNQEVGAKWDAGSGLALTAAAYQLDRNNSAAADPTNPALLVQTGSQRTTGVELGATGEVTVALAGGRRARRAAGAVPDELHGRAGRRDGAARAGARGVAVEPGAGRAGLGLGLGVLRQGRSYAAVDNAVTLPALHALRRGGVRRASGAACARSSTSRTCSTRATTPPRTATTTSCRARRAPCGSRSRRGCESAGAGAAPRRLSAPAARPRAARRAPAPNRSRTCASASRSRGQANRGAASAGGSHAYAPCSPAPARAGAPRRRRRRRPPPPAPSPARPRAGRCCGGRTTGWSRCRAARPRGRSPRGARGARRPRAARRVRCGRAPSPTRAGTGCPPPRAEAPAPATGPTRGRGAHDVTRRRRRRGARERHGRPTWRGDEGSGAGHGCSAAAVGSRAPRRRARFPPHTPRRARRGRAATRRRRVPARTCPTALAHTGGVPPRAPHDGARPALAGRDAPREGRVGEEHLERGTRPW
jgi:catecholate siderophore receptor